MGGRHAGRNVSRLWQRRREVTAGRGHGDYRPEDWAQAVAGSSLGATCWVRVGCVTLVLALLSTTGFVQALASDCRLWQLNEKRVSASENGSFQAFLQETRWCRRLLSGGLADKKSEHSEK